MDNELRQATRAQAQAVREYLAGIGHDISHTQALEALARGRGLRSRQLLAAQIDAALATTTLARDARAHPARIVGEPFTRVRYAYVDGANCKRASQMVFRGRLTPEQLRLLASRLDEGLFFLPAQVGFENLQFAFTLEGDDHGWHRIELDDEQHWTLDDEGYVLHAGGIEQVFDAATGQYATDADCENLFWRFARVLEWNCAGQQDVVTRGLWSAPDRPGGSAEQVAGVLARGRGLRRCPPGLVQDVVQALLSEGFALSVHAGAKELRREVGPNAYQFCLLEAPESAASGGLWLNFDVTTVSGKYLTHAPRVCVDPANPQAGLEQLARDVCEQREAVRWLPEVWDKAFE